METRSRHPGLTGTPRVQGLHIHGAHRRLRAAQRTASRLGFPSRLRLLHRRPRPHERELADSPRATCPARRSHSKRPAKIRAHAILPDYDVSLWIDNSVVLLRPPEEAVAELLPEGVPLAMVAHSFRATVRDEFAAVADGEFDAPSRLEEQLAHYESAIATRSSSGRSRPGSSCSGGTTTRRS